MNTPKTDALIADNFYDDCGTIGEHPEWTVSEATCAKFIDLSRQLEGQVNELRNAIKIVIEDCLEDGHWQETKRSLNDLLERTK